VAGLSPEHLKALPPMRLRAASALLATNSNFSKTIRDLVESYGPVPEWAIEQNTNFKVTGCNVLVCVLKRNRNEVYNLPLSG
jgi:hypothetical protein